MLIDTNEGGEEVKDDIEETPEDDASQEGKAPEDKSDKAPRKDETPEARVARLERQLEQARKKAGLQTPDNAPTTKPSDLDHGQKAYLVATLQIKGAAEWGLVKEYVANGKSIDDLVDNRHFQNDLKDLRDAAAAQAAIPEGTKRGSQPARSTAEYWIAKDELPPSDGTEATKKLRQAVVNARLRAKTTGNQFSATPIVK